MAIKKLDNITRADFPEVEDWSKWDEIVERVKKDIQETLDKLRQKKEIIKNNREKPNYIYNKDGSLKKQCNSIVECAIFLRVGKTTVGNYLYNEWNINGYLVSFNLLTKDVAFAMYKFNMEHGKQYFKGERKKRIPIYVYNENGILVSAFSSRLEFEKKYKNVKTHLTQDKIIDDKLVTLNRYSELQAKANFQKLNKPKKVRNSSYNRITVWDIYKDNQFIKTVEGQSGLGEFFNVAKSTVAHYFKRNRFWFHGYLVVRNIE